MPKLISFQVRDMFLKRDDVLRTLFIGETAVAFTPIEYRLLLCFLEHETLSDQHLICTFGCTKLDASTKQNLRKHIENMNSKLKMTDLSIRRVHLYGYSLIVGQAAARSVNQPAS